MRWSDLFNFIGLIVLLVVQLFIIDQWSTNWWQPNFLLVVLIVWLIVQDWSRVRFWIIGLAMILEWLSVYPPGSQFLFWPVVLAIVNWLYLKLFINKSFYAFSSLVIIGTVLQQGLIVLVSNGWLMPGLVTRFLGQLLTNWLIVAVIYYILYWVDKRINPLFLVKDN